MCAGESKNPTSDCKANNTTKMHGLHVAPVGVRMLLVIAPALPLTRWRVQRYLEMMSGSILFFVRVVALVCSSNRMLRRLLPVSSSSFALRGIGPPSSDAPGTLEEAIVMAKRRNKFCNRGNSNSATEKMPHTTLNLAPAGIGLPLRVVIAL